MVFIGESWNGRWEKVEAAIYLGNDKPRVCQKVVAGVGLHHGDIAAAGGEGRFDQVGLEIQSIC